MSQSTIRPAAGSDLVAIEAIVADAFDPYVARLGRRPAPMKADYPRLVDEGRVFVLELDGRVQGLTVLHVAADHLLLDNVAVGREAQGRGLGRRLLDHAEAYARERGIGTMRLYTNELMHENLAIYARLGWTEERRAEEDGFRRVFLRKRVGAAQNEAAASP